MLRRGHSGGGAKEGVLRTGCSGGGNNNNNNTGCLKKNARLRLEAYNSSLQAVVGTCRDIFGILRFSAFI